MCFQHVATFFSLLVILNHRIQPQLSKLHCLAFLLPCCGRRISRVLTLKLDSHYLDHVFGSSLSSSFEQGIDSLLPPTQQQQPWQRPHHPYHRRSMQTVSGSRSQPRMARCKNSFVFRYRLRVCFCNAFADICYVTLLPPLSHCTTIPYKRSIPYERMLFLSPACPRRGRRTFSSLRHYHSE